MDMVCTSDGDLIKERRSRSEDKEQCITDGPNTTLHGTGNIRNRLESESFLDA